MNAKPFLWERRVPEDFIVIEDSSFPLEEKGSFYLYLLVKRNLTTKEVCKRYNLSYAGLKDKFALTAQRVSSQAFLGNFLREEFASGSWFILKFLGRVRKKVKVGQLKGNKFAVNVSGFPFRVRGAFINYYDVQRVSGNWERGRELLLQLSSSAKRKLSWTQNFLIDAYLSYLWNKSLEMFLRERFAGYYVYHEEESFFIPTELEGALEELPKFWTILGYKKKLLHSRPYYEKLLEEQGFDIQSFLDLLRMLRIKGDYRMLYVVPRNVKQTGNYLFFYLPKGSFATMYLKHIQV